MNPETSNSKERKGYKHLKHLSLAADEIAKVRETLQKVTSGESDLKSFLSGLAECLENLTERIDKLESIVTDAFESAVTEAQREEEIKESLRADKTTLEAQLHEREETLQTKETCIQELEANLAVNAQDIERHITEKENLLEVRDSALKDLRSAMGSLSILARELASFDGRGSDVQEGNGEEQQKTDAELELKEKEIEGLKQQTEAQVERLKAEAREKDAMLAARAMEVEMLKQRADSRIRKLEDEIKKQNQRKKTGFVSFLSDFGDKRRRQ